RGTPAPPSVRHQPHPGKGRSSVAYCSRIALAVFGLVLSLSLPAAALSYSNLFVFGDSLVDTGNTQPLVVGLGGADPTPAAAGYFDGRFANGINFADVVNIADGEGSIDHRLAGGDNFAYGARARAAR